MLKIKKYSFPPTSLNYLQDFSVVELVQLKKHVWPIKYVCYLVLTLRPISIQH